MHHCIDSPKLPGQSTELEDSGIGAGDNDLIHSKIQRMHLDKLRDRQHGYPGIKPTSLAEEKGRNYRVA
jgi:hypothetical protein